MRSAYRRSIPEINVYIRYVLLAPATKRGLRSTYRPKGKRYGILRPIGKRGISFSVFLIIVLTAQLHLPWLAD